MKLAIATSFYNEATNRLYTESLVTSCKVLDLINVKWEYWPLGNDTYIDRARNTLVSRFYRSDCTDLLFIDSDISWDVGGLLRLLQSPYDFTAGLYPKKGKWEQFAGCINIINDIPVQDPETGLIEALSVPAGFMRITKNCIDKLTKAYQNDWYRERDEKVVRLFNCDNIDNQYIGEDISFCQKWSKMGGKIYVEPRITFGHTGSTTYNGNYHEYLLRIAEEERVRIAINEGVKI